MIDYTTWLALNQELNGIFYKMYNKNFLDFPSKT